MTRYLALVVALFLAGCPNEPETPAPTPTADTPAPEGVAPEADPLPQAPKIPVDEVAKLLPVDENGDKVLWDTGQLKVVLGPKHEPGPNTAMAACQDLETSCLVASKDERDVVLDNCVARLPICETPEPWNEAACCPQACIAAYQRERELGATQFQAGRAVFSSIHECFPGLQEWYRAQGGTPHLAPRRAQ